jgi:hypothetical protein
MRADLECVCSTRAPRPRRLEVLFLVLSVTACDSSFRSTRPEPAVSLEAAPVGEAAPESQRAPLDLFAPYPHARWRLAPRAQLGSVRIWASHILIEHRDAPMRGAVFGPPESGDAPVRTRTRTRAEASVFAAQVAREAHAAPEQFAELARRRSDDRMTQTTGGSLGALHGVSLLPFPQVLDAFAALRPGEVSRVVETEYGFHVFRLRSPPPAHTFNAAHIVVGYDEATWLAQNLARGPVPRRSRAEALALATALYERAKAAPLEFAQLVAQHSEHIDAAHAGDMGAWSTQQPDAYSRELELLLDLPVHGVAPPIDTLFGFEVVQRTPDRPRERFAMQMIRLPFDASAASSEPTSRQAMLARVTALAQQLSTDPLRFAAIQAEYCCAGHTMEWTEHQEPTLLAFATERLALGEIAAQPIEFASSFAIPKRVDPELVPRRNPLEFQLPAPEDVNLESVASRTPRAVMQEHLSKVAVQAERALALDEARAAELRNASQLPAELSDEATGAEKRAALRGLLERVSVSLGAESYARYLELNRAYFRAWVLEQPF